MPHPLVDDPSIWIASSYLPGGRRSLLGGDFYDAVQTADGSLHVMVGDVSGRGPDAAALGAALRIAWRALTLSGTPGDNVLRTLDLVTQHERQAPGIFATLCMLEIEPGRTGLALRRAGHPPPVLLADSVVTSLPLDGGGPPIGLFVGSEWPESRIELPDAWALLLYTDGVIEGGVNRSPDRLGRGGSAAPDRRVRGPPTRLASRPAQPARRPAHRGPGAQRPGAQR